MLGCAMYELVRGLLQAIRGAGLNRGSRFVSAMTILLGRSSGSMPTKQRYKFMRKQVWSRRIIDQLDFMADTISLKLV